MNIIKITGGLGNQMFQYALYLKLQSMGRKVKMDALTEYTKENPRPNMLWCFDAEYEEASREDINILTDGFMKLSHRIRRKIFGRKSLEYHEKDYNFDLQILEREPAYLTGYFQSEKYFKDIEEQIRRAFTFSEKIWEVSDKALVEKIRDYQKQIEKTKAISLHVRRGDYVASSEVYGGICTDAYYQKAIAVMEERVPGAVFYVFSNEPAFVKEQLLEYEPKEDKFVVIEGTTEETGYLDLFLMSKCRHHIVANSSFSWWGAWLNPDKDKVVIAPDKWLNHQQVRDIYTEGMIKISPKGKLVQ